MKLISFIIPCYNSSKTLESVIKEIKDTVFKIEGYDYEIILVNDYSPDGVYEVIKKLCYSDSKIKGIKLSKNFGQQAAIMAGLNIANGEIITLLDDDGQIAICELGKLINKLDEGYDVVYGKYSEKKQSFVRNIGSKINEKMTNLLIDKPKDIYISSFYVCRRYVIEEVIKYNNPYPYLYGLILRVTKNIANVEVPHRDRKNGKSNYTLKKLFGLWLNGFTAFSVKPLRVATITGIICAVLGFCVGIYTIINKLVNPETPAGYSSTMAVLLFIGGMIMLMLGLIGEYIGRIYISINNSPQYVIREAINIYDELEMKREQ